MTRIERVIYELSDLYDFWQRLQRMKRKSVGDDRNAVQHSGYSSTPLSSSADLSASENKEE